MESIDIMVLRTLAAWRAAGHAAILITVTRTWGSSPRSVGAMMALRHDGHVVGSVSGGCIEDDLIGRYTAVGNGAMPAQGCERVTYGIAADDAHRFGLPCGGTLELLLETNPAQSLLHALVQRLDNGEMVRRVVVLRTGQVQLQPASQPEPLIINDRHLASTLGPGYRMLLIGAGALAQYLATMALFNGFKVTVCDPRQARGEGASMPEVTRVMDMPDDAVIAFRPDARSCVIALTHDPKLDDLALLEALDSPAFYVGAIGSRRNNASRRKRFIEHLGQSEAALSRLRGPIGLYIGSKTPAEIAVSVMAEVLAVKNGVVLVPEMTAAAGKAWAQRLAEQG